MYLAKVIGTIWATQKYASLEGATMQLIQPLKADETKEGGPIVAIDTIGAGAGETVVYITAREAVIPYPVEMAPIDASIIGIVDNIDVYDQTT